MQINIARHTVNNVETNGYVWAIFEDGPTVCTVPVGTEIRWAGDEATYRVRSINERLPRFFDYIEKIGFVEVSSWDGFKSARFQLSWKWQDVTPDQYTEMVHLLKRELGYAFGALVPAPEIRFGLAPARS
jgi:hypothetical protein